MLDPFPFVALTLSVGLICFSLHGHRGVGGAETIEQRSGTGDLFVGNGIRRDVSVGNGRDVIVGTDRDQRASQNMKLAAQLM